MSATAAPADTAVDLAAAVARVGQDHRDQDPHSQELSDADAVLEARAFLEHADLDELVRTGLMTDADAAAYRLVLDAAPDDLDAVFTAAGGRVDEADGEDGEVVEVVESGDADAACAAACAAASAAAVAAREAGDEDVVAVVVLEDLAAECDGDAY